MIHTKIATERDIEAICAFELKARETEPEAFIFDFDVDTYRQKLLSSDMNNNSLLKIVLAYSDDEVVGRCDIQILPTLTPYDSRGYIDWIYTLVNKRGKKIGKALLDASEEYFKSQNIKDYYLFTASNPQAQKFYKTDGRFTFSSPELAEKEL